MAKTLPVWSNVVKKTHHLPSKLKEKHFRSDSLLLYSSFLLFLYVTENKHGLKNGQNHGKYRSVWIPHWFLGVMNDDCIAVGFNGSFF